MAGPAWIEGAERLGDGSIGGAMDSPDLPPRCVQHTVEAPAGRGWFVSMASYLISAGVEPQILYDPDSDSLGQFGPLNQSGRALRNAGSVRTNRTGKVCVQWEVCGRAAKPWTTGFDPASKPNYLRAVAAMRAWGIPDTWPAGAPQAYPGDHDDRDMDTWLHRGGWFGHSQVPGNDHGDPGAIDTSKVPWRGSVPSNSSSGGFVSAIETWSYANPADGPDAWQRLKDTSPEATWNYKFGETDDGAPSAADYLRGIHGDVVALSEVVNALAAKVNAMTAPTSPAKEAGK